MDPWFRISSNAQTADQDAQLHFIDSGLLGATLGLTAERILKNRGAFGALLESFVFSEVTKQTEWSDENYTLHHYRDKDQDEVDIIVEDEQGALVGIEVKAGATVHCDRLQRNTQTVGYMR